MGMSNYVRHLVCVLVCACMGEVGGHLCLITPRQRGPMDISQGGSHTCFRHGPECGGEPFVFPPNISLRGGSPLFIKWQQNFNHYSVGYPGYMDIGFAAANGDQAELDSFTILATVSDVYKHDQDHQRNYTAVVTLPNIDCEHCIIRARYVAHKPGETTFYQCADITVRKSTQELTVKKRSTVQLFDAVPNPNNVISMNKPQAAVVHPKLSVLVDGVPMLLESSLEQPHGVRPRDMDVEPTSAQNKDQSIAGEDRIRKALSLIRLATASSDRRTSQGGIPSEEGSASSPTPRARDGDEPARLYGMSNQADSPLGAVYYSVDVATGERRELGVLDFHVDSPFDPSARGQIKNGTHDYVTAGVLTLDSARYVSVLALNSHDNMDAIASTVIEIDTLSGRTKAKYDVIAPNITRPMASFSAMVVEIENTFATFDIEPAEEPGQYYFVIGRLFTGGIWQQLSKTNQPEDTYVNFLWADYDIAVKTLYVLLGNENDPYNLTARLYKFFVPPGPPINPSPDFYSFVQLDVSRYTVSSFHISPFHTNQLYAVSPGRHEDMYPAYHLVVIDVDMGTISDVMQITPPGIFQRYYGGCVINGLDEITNKLVHVLRVADSSTDVIASIDIIHNDPKKDKTKTAASWITTDMGGTILKKRRAERTRKKKLSSYAYFRESKTRL